MPTMKNFAQPLFLYALFWIPLQKTSSATVSKTNEPQWNCVVEWRENISDERKTCICEFFTDGETIRNRIEFQAKGFWTDDGYNRDFVIDCYYQNVTYELLLEMTTECDFKMNAVYDIFYIQNCPIFNVPYANLLEALHIELLCDMWIHSGLDFHNGFVPYNFKNLTSVEMLEISNTTLHDSPLDMFDDMLNLTRLDLSGNFLSASQKPLKPTYVPSTISANESIIQKEWFKFPPGLKSLEFTNNEPKLQNITKTAFANLIKLQRLDLHTAGIEYLDDNVFDQLEQLKFLYLDYNNLTRLPANLFFNNRKLEMVSMTKTFNKEIFTLPDRLFANLTLLETVRIEYNHFTTLPENLYENCYNLKEIYMSDNKLITLPDSIFKDTIQLYHLDISFNRLRYLNHTIFHVLQNLRVLIMRNAFSTQTLTLHSELFAGLTSLEEVYVDDSKLTSLPEDLFRNCRNLTKIGLSSNFLTAIPLYLFKRTVLLEHLDLSYNQFEFLNDTAFSTLNNLERLKLAGNRLQFISRNLLDSLSSLTTLNLESNNLTDFEDDSFQKLKHLTDLNLSNNQLTLNRSIRNSRTRMLSYSPFVWCEKLEVLNLENNLLEYMFYDWKRNLTTLQSLKLTSNKFRSLQSSDMIFKRPRGSSEFTVDLSRNQIERILVQELFDEEYLTAIFMHGEQVIFNLEHNPIVCNCSALRFVQAIQQKRFNDINVQFHNLYCQQPQQLRNVSLEEINLLDLKCPLNATHTNENEECPTRCLCEYRPADLHVLVNCTGNGMEKFPTQLPYISGHGLQLVLAHNNISSLDGMSNLPLVANTRKVTSINLSFNKLRSIDDITIWNGLKVLKLDNNQISYLSENAIAQLKRSKTLENLTLHNNPWQCDCEHQHFADFIHHRQHAKLQISNLNDIICQNNQKPIQRQDDFCEEYRRKVLLLWIVSTGVIIIAALVLWLLYYNYEVEIKVWLFAHPFCRCLFREIGTDENVVFDAFVCFSMKDLAFVEQHLMAQLEPRYNLCVRYRDFIVGRYIIDQIVEAVDLSSITIIVLSRNFLQSRWGPEEFRVAHNKAIQERRKRVLIILLDDMDTKDIINPALKAYLSTRTFIKWGDPLFWQKLNYDLSYPTNNSEQRT